MKLASICIAAGMTISAAPILGTLNFTGNAQLSTNSINFQCNLLGLCSGSNGDFFITGGSANSGEFAAISILNRFGQVSDITTPPLDTTISLSNFAEFVGNPDVVLDLTKVFSGTGSACPPSAATVCTPSGSPLNISQTPTGATATFSVLANARRLSTGELTPYQGLFTLQFTRPPSDILTELATSTVNTSYSATFSPFTPLGEVPEPMSWILVGSGLLLAIAKRK